jgi:hydrogenase expression/formation protein HypD
MKFLDEYRDAGLAEQFARELHRVTTRPWKIMEVCGGQTHAIVKFGIDELLPEEITLIHGPGCPVCVTPLEMIDKALALAARPDVIFTSFGDMLRVPGLRRAEVPGVGGVDEGRAANRDTPMRPASATQAGSAADLLSVKAKGGDVRMVYSPLDAVKLAEQNPAKEVVFFGVGFETTAPATAMAIHQAAQKKLENFSMLISHVLVPPAIEALMSSPNCQVRGFLAAGHVCTVMGFEEYFPLAKRYRVPIVVTGFEPLDILQGVLMTVQQLESGRAGVENQYARAVRREGNRPAQELIRQIFQVVTRKWRGIGEIPRSGLGLRAEFAAFDAEKKFGLAETRVEEPPECLSGLVLQGQIKPHECPAFGVKCTPEHPLGAPMVSGEGACAAYYRYRRHGFPTDEKCQRMEN